MSHASLIHVFVCLGCAAYLFAVMWVFCMLSCYTSCAPNTCMTTNLAMCACTVSIQCLMQQGDMESKLEVPVCLSLAIAKEEDTIVQSMLKEGRVISLLRELKTANNVVIMVGDMKMLNLLAACVPATTCKSMPILHGTTFGLPNKHVATHCTARA